jgi:hypothetical protein
MRAPEEAEVEHGEHDRAPLDLAAPAQERFVLLGSRARLLDLVEVGRAVLEAEAIERGHFREVLLPSPLVDRHRHALASGQREVKLAGRADAALLFELLAIEHRAAALALEPQAARHVLFLAQSREARLAQARVGDAGVVFLRFFGHVRVSGRG